VPFSTRVAILGHLQRGGAPAPADRILASQLGALAVQAIHDGQTGKMAGQVRGELALTPFADTYSEHKPIPPELLDLLEVLAS
jgi:6-phosphofructokinase 1